MAESRFNRRNKKKLRRWVKRTLWSFFIVVLVGVSISGYFFYQAYNAAKDAYEGLDRPGERSELREEKVTIGDDPVSILLMGIEHYSSPNGKVGRADTQIVVTLNPDTNKMTMTSIPRDTGVKIPAEKVGKGIYAGTHKINAAYAFGDKTGYGANKLTVEMVEDFLDIPIDKYVAVDFEGFREIVNTLGGVSVDIKYGFWEENIFNNNKRIYFEPGLAHLDGAEALAFVRMRKRDIAIEYTRMERQQQFIKAAIDEAISASTVWEVDEMNDIFGKHVKTNLKSGEILDLQQAYSSIDSSSIDILDIKGSNVRIPEGTGYWYFVPNEESLREVKQQLREALQLSTDVDKEGLTNQGNSEND